jgi:hypothetical protein
VRTYDVTLEIAWYIDQNGEEEVQSEVVLGARLDVGLGTGGDEEDGSFFLGVES